MSCHSTATCHAAGRKNSIRHIENRSSPYFVFVTCHVKSNLAGTANLALCPTVTHSKSHSTPTVKHSKTRSTPHCQAQQTSPSAPLSGTKTSHCEPLSDTANLALCPIVRHNKPRLMPYSQAQQTPPCASLSRTANLAPRSSLRHFKPRTHVSLSDTANLAPRHPRYSKPRTTPQCHAQQISPHAQLSDTTNIALCRTVSNDA